MDELLDLTGDPFNELRVVVAQNASEHARSEVQKLIPVRIENRTAAAFDEHLVSIRHCHQDVITILLPIVQVVCVPLCHVVVVLYLEDAAAAVAGSLPSTAL